MSNRLANRFRAKKGDQATSSNPEMDALRNRIKVLEDLVSPFVGIVWHVFSSQLGVHQPLSLSSSHSPPLTQITQLSQSVLIAGHINKYIPRNEQFLTKQWDIRYIIVRMDQDNVGQLLYWKSDKEVATLPRAKIDLANTYILPEGEKYVGPTIFRPLTASYYWAWKLVDKKRRVLLRLSTDNQAEYQKWLDALTQAGCKPFDGATTVASTSGSGGDGSNRASPAPSASASSLDDNDDDGLRGSGGEEVSSEWKKRTGPPAHNQICDSVLAWRRLTLSENRGFLVLMMIWLFVVNFRMVIENSLKYGIRFAPLAFIKALLVPQHVARGPSTLICWSVMAAAIVLPVFIEKFAALFLNLELKKKAGLNKKTDSDNSTIIMKVANTTSSSSGGTSTAAAEWLFLGLHVIVLLGMIGGVWHAVTLTAADPLPGFVATMMMIVIGMKVISYIHINHAHRQARRSGEVVPGERGSGLKVPGWKSSELPKYPENITFKNMAYFMVAPTLCYQLAYPWDPLIRLRRVMKRALSLFFLVSLMLFITEQYIEPAIDNSIKPLQEMDWLRMLERVLKLAIPTLVYWLVMFYTVFHVWLNLLAEVTHFGDREFYSYWWNATTMGEYWRLWNMPVHKWMLRHVYFPCLNVGMNKLVAGGMTFFVSAVLHEVGVGMPLNMLRFWSFAAIMGQLPMIYLTEQLRAKTGNGDVGNAIFWISFCFLGQPLALILYFHDYRIMSLGLC